MAPFSLVAAEARPLRRLLRLSLRRLLRRFEPTVAALKLKRKSWQRGELAKLMLPLETFSAA
jgi:hypothetical protein